MAGSIYQRLLGLDEDLVAPDYYQLLGLEPGWIDTTKMDEAVAKGREQLSKVAPEDRPVAQKLAQLLDHARTVLSESASRSRYDEALKASRSEDIQAYVGAMVSNGQLPAAANRAILQLMGFMDVDDQLTQDAIAKGLKKAKATASSGGSEPSDAPAKALQELQEFAAERAERQFLEQPIAAPGAPTSAPAAAPESASEPVSLEALPDQKPDDDAPLELMGESKTEEPVDIGNIDDLPDVPPAGDDPVDLGKIDDLPDAAPVEDVGTLEDLGNAGSDLGDLPPQPAPEQPIEKPPERRRSVNTSKRSRGGGTSVRPAPAADIAALERSARRWTRSFAAAFLVAAAFVVGDVVAAMVTDSGRWMDQQTGSLQRGISGSLGTAGGVGAVLGGALVVYVVIIWLAGFRSKVVFMIPTLLLMIAAYAGGAIPVGEERSPDAALLELRTRAEKAEGQLDGALDKAKAADAEIATREETIAELKKSESGLREQVTMLEGQLAKSQEEVRSRDAMIKKIRTEAQGLQAVAAERDTLKARTTDQEKTIEGLKKKTGDQERMILALQKQVADLRKALGSKNN